MKLLKTSVAALLALAVLFTATLTAGAAVDQTAAIDKAMNFFATELKDDYVEKDETGATKLEATFWEFACLYRWGKAADPAYSFLVPDFDAADLNDESTPSQIATTALGLLMQGKDATSAVQMLAARQQEDGTFSGPTTEVTGYSWAILSLLAAKENGIEADFDLDKAVQAIAAAAKEDGGYNDWGEEGNVDTTGMVMMGLAAAGTDAADEALKSAAAFLASTMQEDGYFVGQGEYDSANSCSQAFGIIGLICAGEDLSAGKWSKSIDALLRCQDENGGFWYQETPSDFFPAPDAMSTYQAILALQDLSDGSNFFVGMTKEPLSKPTENSSAASMISTPSSASSSASEQSSATSIPETGDEGISPVVWALLGVAVLVLIVLCIIPVVNKKKKK